MKRALLLILLALPCHAQITLLNPTCTGTNSACFCTGGSTCTTSGIDMRGASLIVVSLAVASHSTTTGSPPLSTGNPVFITDSSGNTYYCGTPISVDSCGYGADNKGVTQQWYAIAPVTTSNMTFSASKFYVSLFVQGYSGTATSPLACVYDTSNGQYCGDSVTTCQTGSITPAGTGELLVPIASSQDSITALSINDSFSLLGFEPSSANSAGGNAYLVDSSATAINPTWSWTSGAEYMGASITAYKPLALCGTKRLRGYVVHSK